jgi:hypothetical protein
VFVIEINTTDSQRSLYEGGGGDIVDWKEYRKKKIKQLSWSHIPNLFLKYLTQSCWMCYCQAAEMVIKESVEPLLEEYRPPGITSLKFSKLSLGNVAPKIEGVNH